MDLPLLGTDDQTRSPPALTESQTGNLDTLSLHIKSAYETGIEIVSDLSDPTDKSTEPLSNVPKCLSHETSSNSDYLKPLSSSYNMSECFSHCSETMPKNNNLRVQVPLLPHLSHDIISPASEIYTEHESALTFSFIEETTTPQTLGVTSSTLEGLMKQPGNETFSSSSSEYSRESYLLRSLSHPSDSLESDTAIAPMSDLYIFESETQDFILSPNADSQENTYSEYLSSPQTDGKEADRDWDTNILMCDSTEVVSQCHQSKEWSMPDYESDVKQHTGLKPPAVDACDGGLMSVNDARQGTAEVNGLPSQTRRSDSPIELWLDACQYLPGDTRVSDYNPDGSDEIGWSSDDNNGWPPPVERWSSVDSWTTALSDWTGILMAPPEDITAAFTEIGAEIDALTQALAEVIPHTDTESSIDGQSQQESSVQKLIPGSTSSSDLELSHFGEYAKSLESDIFISNEEIPIILNIIEDSDLEGKTPSDELMIEKPFRDKVTKEEHHITQLGLEAEKQARRSCDLAEDDCEGIKVSTDPHFLKAHTQANSCVSEEDAQPDPHIEVHAHLSSDTLVDLDGASQAEPMWGSPKFIMPLAPLGVGSSFTSLGRDQTCTKRFLNDNRDFNCDHLQPCELWTTCGGITNIPSLEGHEELIHQTGNTTDSAEKFLPKGQLGTGDTAECFVVERKTIIEDINDLNKELSNLTVIPTDNLPVSEKNRVASITLDLNDPFVSRTAQHIATAERSHELNYKPAEKMPHKTHKTTSEGKTRTKKDKSAGHCHGAPASKKQEISSHHLPVPQTCKQKETEPLLRENHTSQDNEPKPKEDKLVIETGVVAERATNKPHGKKKKKHSQKATVKSAGEPLVEVENGAKPKTAKKRIETFEAKLGANTGKPQKNSDHSDGVEVKANPTQEEQPAHQHKDHQQQNVTSTLKDDVIKRRRLSKDKFGKIVSALDSKLPKPDASFQVKGEVPKTDVGATRKKAYSDVVKQKTITPKEEPKVVQPIQAASISEDPQSLCLWCQFSDVFTDYTVTWSREGTVLAEVKRSAGDESRVSLTICNASHKDLGKYHCQLSSVHASVTLDYLLTYEVLSEVVIPPSPKTITSAPIVAGLEEDDVQCSRLMFKEDFLSDQYFGENHDISIVTEEAHFGEGMHRRAFRTRLQAGQVSLLLPGPSCVLKVHTALSYGTKNNEELLQKNYNLAVEECQVQNTAREYIKAYTAVAQAVEAFGEIPEIIPIYLIHRPSNDIPYATLEEELIGDFVKYSVKDGKEINLMRRDSEAGRKCCAFQHWVYHKTEGNLLVTDMQGVGMKLTDVGIATCKKGYQGFKGNCATSFIEQFKALHQCNTYCEILGLKSLQPKPKKPAFAPKPKPQAPATPKKKTFGPMVKGKS